LLRGEVTEQIGQLFRFRTRHGLSAVSRTPFRKGGSRAFCRRSDGYRSGAMQSGSECRFDLRKRGHGLLLSHFGDVIVDKEASPVNPQLLIRERQGV
jgi:hypothetical protein